MNTRRLATYCIAALMTVATGCAVLPATHFVKQDTPYYRNGPGENVAPDGYASGGQRVWEAEQLKNGFTRVWLNTWTIVDIRTGDLVPADKWESMQSGKKK